MQTPLQRLTVIIPTISRPLFVRRQIDYWSNFDAQVRILDGALAPIDLSDKRDIPSNVRYIHQPVKFNERLANASNLISTEFACLLPDDEFFLPTGMVRCIDHLDQHPEHIGAVGKVLQFFVDQGQFRAFQDYQYWKNFDLGKSGSARDRVRQVIPPNKAHKIQFAILRSETWAKIFRTSYSDFYSTGYLYERMLNLYAAVLGESVVLDVLLWMRSMENPPISSDAVPRDDRGGMLGWADDPAMTSEVSHYFEKVAKIISEGSDIGPDDAREFASQFVYGGFDAHREKIQKSQQNVWKQFALWLVKNTPKKLKLWAKRNVSVSVLKRFDWTGYPLDVVAQQLSDRGIEFNTAEIKRIEQLALHTDSLR